MNGGVGPFIEITDLRDPLGQWMEPAGTHLLTFGARSGVRLFRTDLATEQTTRVADVPDLNLAFGSLSGFDAGPDQRIYATVDSEPYGVYTLGLQGAPIEPVATRDRGVGPELYSPRLIATDRQTMTAYVFSEVENGPEGIYEVDLVSGDRTLLSTEAQSGFYPEVLFLSPAGALFGINRDEIYEIDRTTAAHTLVTGPGRGAGRSVESSNDPGAAFDSLRNRILLVSKSFRDAPSHPDPNYVVMAVDVSTGDRSVLMTDADFSFVADNDSDNNEVCAHAIGVSQDGSTAWIVGEGGGLFRVDLAAGTGTEIRAEFAGSSEAWPRGGTGGARAVVSDETHTLIVGKPSRDALYVFDCITGESVAVRPPAPVQN